MTYTTEQIATALHEAREHIRSSGGKKTPGVENRRVLIEIVEQLRRDNAKEDREHLETIKERDQFEDTISEAARALGCEEEWSNVHDHAECVVELAKELRAEVNAHRAELIEGAKQSVVVTCNDFLQIVSEESP